MKWIINATVLAIGLAIIMLLQSLVGVSDVTALSSSEIIQQEVFPHDQVVDVNITIDQGVYEAMIENASLEEMVMADITYNGVTIESVGIRPKGNSSLKDVVRNDGDRFSFKVNMDEYIDGQNLFGLDKINLNNLYSDPSMMAEYLSYEMLDYLGADAPSTTFVNLSINDEYFGLYLAVEQVDENFLIDHYGNADGILYKPDMGTGSDLVYREDGDYSGLYDELGKIDDNTSIDELMRRLSTNEPIDDIFNVDSFLKYLAVSSLVIHYDAYQGSMFHNYYLYDNNGQFEWISWDLNMSFNGFPMAGMSDAEAVTNFIDEPVLGSMSDYPLIEVILGNEDYKDQYHDYLQMLIDGYANDESFANRVIETKEMIDSFVKADTSKFYSYEEYLEGLTGQSGLIAFMSERVENINSQLRGDLPSSNNGAGNERGENGKTNRPDMQGNQLQDSMMAGQNNGQMLNRQDQSANNGVKPEKAGMANPSFNLDDIVKLVGKDQIPDAIYKALSEGSQPDMDQMRTFMDSLDEEVRMQLMGPPPQGNDIVNQKVDGPDQIPMDKGNISNQNVEDANSGRDALGISLGIGGCVLLLGVLLNKLRR